MLGFIMNLQVENVKAEFILIGLNSNKDKIFVKKVTLYGSKDIKLFITSFLNKNWNPILSSLKLHDKMSETESLEAIDIKFSVTK